MNNNKNININININHNNINSNSSNNNNSNNSNSNNSNNNHQHIISHNDFASSVECVSFPRAMPTDCFRADPMRAPERRPLSRIRSGSVVMPSKWHPCIICNGVASVASCSTGTGAAKEPNLWGRMWAPDGEEVPLPRNFKRKRTHDSDEVVWDPMALQRWHDKRQKVESSAVAGKESSAVAGNGGMIVVDLREENNEEVSSQATTLQLGSLANKKTQRLPWVSYV